MYPGRVFAKSSSEIIFTPLAILFPSKKRRGLSPPLNFRFPGLNLDRLRPVLVFLLIGFRLSECHFITITLFHYSPPVWQEGRGIEERGLPPFIPTPAIRLVLALDRS